MTMEPTSRDKIERSAVIQEPIPSILAIGQSIIVVIQVKLRSGSAYQGVHSGADHAMRSISTFFDVGWLDGFGEARSAASWFILIRRGNQRLAQYNVGVDTGFRVMQIPARIRRFRAALLRYPKLFRRLARNRFRPFS